MAGRIIGFISAFTCAFPFWVISVYGKSCGEPISFWSGDDSLKEKIASVGEYNRCMSRLYRGYAIAYLLAAVASLVHPIAGLVLLLLNLTIGIVLVYRFYKSYLKRYSK